MSKRIEITPELSAEITRANNGAEIDAATIAAFEARLISTRPLRKKGLYNGAKITANTLGEMVTSLNTSNEGLPLHLMHDRDLLNVGKIFMSRVDRADDGHTELSILFYLPTSEDKLVSRLDSSVVDQVSVGMLTKHLYCSECHFDYLGDQSDIMNLMTMTCGNEHTIGENGTHLICQDLDTWFESSLVDRGGAEGARIVSADQSRFVKQEEFYRIAASNQNHPEKFVPIIANLDEFTSEEVSEMDEAKVNELIQAALTAANTQHKEVTDALEAKIAELTPNEQDEVADDVPALKAEIAELKQKVTDLEASAQEEEDVTDFLNEQAQKAQAAAGVKTPIAASDRADAITKIKDSGVLIAKLFAKDEAGNIETDAKSEKYPSLGAFTGKRS